MAQLRLETQIARNYIKIDEKKHGVYKCIVENIYDH